MNTETDVKNSIQSKLTEALYNAYLMSGVSLLIVSTTLALELYRTDAKFIPQWYFIICVLIIARYGLLFWFRRTQSQVHLQKFHYYLFILGSSLAAISLGILGSFLMPSDMIHQSFTLILISGLLAGSSQSLSASYLANMLYILLTLIPILTWELIQIMQLNFIYSGVFATMALFCIYSAVVARRGYLLLVNYIKLEQSNEILLNEALEMKDKFRELATHDILTGIYNRTFGLEYLEKEISRAAREKLEFSVFILDLDHLKKYNDQCGHHVGDEVLKRIAEVINKRLRKQDIICRYGGDEFLGILPNTGYSSALEVAETLRLAVKTITIEKYNILENSVSVSIGLSSYPKSGSSASELIETADKALYRAKQSGRDKVL